MSIHFSTGEHLSWIIVFFAQLPSSNTAQGPVKRSPGFSLVSSHVKPVNFHTVAVPVKDAREHIIDKRTESLSLSLVQNPSNQVWDYSFIHRSLRDGNAA
jgi:hypothetical protein